jgi:hypothetical protein
MLSFSEYSNIFKKAEEKKPRPGSSDLEFLEWERSYEKEAVSDVLSRKDMNNTLSETIPKVSYRIV